MIHSNGEDIMRHLWYEDGSPAGDEYIGKIVRCIDCKFCHETKMPSRPYLCLNHKGLVVIHADSFCSYGERKETE